MKIFNFNNREIPILHLCGQSRSYHKRIFEESGNENIILPNGVSIITFCNKPFLDSAILIKQLKQNGIPYFNPADGLTNWSNTWKPRLLLECIDKVNTEYVLVLDSLDVKVTGAVSELISRFKQYKVDLLFGACKADFPVKNIEKIFKRDYLGTFNKINTGTCFGKKEAVKFIYQKTVSMGLEKNKYNSEQYMIRTAYDECQDFAGFDYNCECFQTFVNTAATPLDSAERQWIIT